MLVGLREQVAWSKSCFRCERLRSSRREVSEAPSAHPCDSVGWLTRAAYIGEVHIFFSCSETLHVKEVLHRPSHPTVVEGAASVPEVLT